MSLGEREGADPVRALAPRATTSYVRLCENWLKLSSGTGATMAHIFFFFKNKFSLCVWGLKDT